MSKRLTLLVLALLCLVYPTVARAQSLVLTLEDGATIQFLVMPDGTQLDGSSPPEPISGGLAAKFMGSGSSGTEWRVVDFRLEGEHWNMRLNAAACGYMVVAINDQIGPLTNVVYTNGGASAPCADSGDTAVIQNTSLAATYTGELGVTAYPFTGTVSDPGEAPISFFPVTFGPAGLAVIQGTLRVEVSDYPATVVNLRQGIPPFPTPVLTEPWSDGNPPWEDDVYDSATDTNTQTHELENRIYNLGCALTSLSMALESAGVSNVPAPAVPNTAAPNDPRNLNTFMNSLKYGYESEAVNFWDTTYALSNALNKPKLTFSFSSPALDSMGLPPPGAPYTYLDNALQQGKPVIVGIDDNCAAHGSKFPCHFVLVWGKRNGEYLIADPKPANYTLTLSDPRCSYGCPNYPRFQTVGYVNDPADVSGLSIATAADVELTLESSLGAQTGFDATAPDSVIQDIPGSAYFVHSLLEDNDAGFSHGPSRFVELSQPAGGQYTLTVTGLAPGLYSADIRTYSQDGSMQPSLTVSGVAGPGSTSVFDIGLNAAPGSTPTAVRSATFRSALADVQNSLRLALITNKGPALSLSAEILAAAGLAELGACKAASGLLRAFEHEVAAQTGKGIDPAAATVLTEDATYLIAHCGSGCVR